MAHIEFTNNYQDLSTENGFQFKFVCESCGNGYLSSWQVNAVGIAGSLLRGAGQIFGGLVQRAAAGSYEVQRAIGGVGHDSALTAAVDEIKPLFHQCSKCGHWACGKVCWNAERGLCSRCAPILEREAVATQAQLAVRQTTQALESQDQTLGIHFAPGAAVGAAPVPPVHDLPQPSHPAALVQACAKCHAPSHGGKFCEQCGAALARPEACNHCGCRLEPAAKFCPECGQQR
jgi:hypothetical protein